MTNAPLLNTNVISPVKAKYLELTDEFPRITHVYGGGNSPDHNNRRCLDLMVYDASGEYEPNNLSRAGQVALGNEIADYLRENHERLGVNGVIWNRRVMGFPHVPNPPYRGPMGVWRPYSGASPHTDHVHVEFDPSAYKEPIMAISDADAEKIARAVLRMDNEIKNTGWDKTPGNTHVALRTAISALGTRLAAIEKKLGL